MGYSSSSEEEESEADTGAEGSSSKRPENDAAAAGESYPVRKKLKTEKQLPETRYACAHARERIWFPLGQ